MPVHQPEKPTNEGRPDTGRPFRLPTNSLFSEAGPPAGAARATAGADGAADAKTASRRHSIRRSRSPSPPLLDHGAAALGRAWAPRSCYRWKASGLRAAGACGVAASGPTLTDPDVEVLARGHRWSWSARERSLSRRNVRDPAGRLRGHDPCIRATKEAQVGDLGLLRFGTTNRQASRANSSLAPALWRAARTRASMPPATSC